ncbi:hypothetical protein D7Y21_33490 [Corallococcus sp. AB045]|uniref:hypothetical protein n=1 Tax=Corallococcus sp. AB045 TaxID=2316719 RepID=UPI000EC5BCDA|nr:hypothetical protein [Corallococcus sp. AB045]RKH79656.1 hypothetical protein D7Y21_33490 [Corallococcus sp. AB045]
MAATILEARGVAPFTVRVRFSDGMEGEASLEPCLFDWDLSRVPDLTPELLLGGRREVWRPGLTVGSAPTNTVVVDRPGVAPHHVKVTVGGGHHPCYVVTVVEGTTTAGGTTSSTPGETWRVPMREPLLLELEDCTVQVD